MMNFVQHTSDPQTELPESTLFDFYLENSERQKREKKSPTEVLEIEKTHFK